MKRMLRICSAFVLALYISTLPFCSVCAESGLMVDVQPYRGSLRKSAVYTAEEAESQCYVISYMDDDGTLLLKANVKEGDPIEKPKLSMKRAGSVFLYWYDAAEKNPSVPYRFGSAAIGNVKLKALYATAPKSK